MPYQHEPEFFQSEADGQWYWRITAPNKNILVGAEGYTQKHNAVKGFNALRSWFQFYESEQAVEASKRKGSGTTDGFDYFGVYLNNSAYAFTEELLDAALLNASDNADTMPEQVDSNTAITSEFVGHRPPHRPR